MAQSYGNTWWGNSWLKSLNHIDYANRIPRGATYARKGSVEEIRIDGNKIVAKVAGSRPKPYKVSISVPAFTKEQTDRLMDKITTRPALISRLLNRELDPEILSIAKSCGLQVFPTQWNDLKMDCNCPDWAVPCKHLAAVIYMMSREIDNNPFLVFGIHHVDLLGELKRRGIAIEKENDMKIPGLAESFQPKKMKDVFVPAPDFHRIDFSRIQDIAEPLMGLLPASPAFYNQGDFQQKYASELTRVIKGAQKILNKKMTVADLFPGFPMNVGAISQHDNIHVILYDSGMASIASVISSTEERKNHFGMTNFDQLLKLLSELPVDFLGDYHSSVAALHQAFYCALHLLANGAVIPGIRQLSSGEYVIRWFPASIDFQVQNVLDELEHLFPGDVVQATVISPKKDIYLANQATNIISFFLKELISRLSGTVQGDDFLKLFFKGHTEQFIGVGEQEIPGGIKVWLDRYFVAIRKYRPVYMVREDEDSYFYLDIGVEDTSQSEVEVIQLKEILTKKVYAKERFSVLRDLLMLSSNIEGLTDYINGNAGKPIRFDSVSLTPFLMKTVPAIRLLAAKVLLPKSLQQLLRPKATLRLSKKNSSGEGSFIRMDELLAFDWQVAVGDEVLSQKDFQRLLKQASGLIRFKQNYIYVDEADLEKLNKSFAQPTKLSNMRLLQAALTEEYDSAPVMLSDEVRNLIRELTEQQDIPLPEGVNATLRPYQKRGFEWMYRNMRIGFGSIMADDMGLGKTLQVITLLQKMKDEGSLKKKKVLIVMPTGLLTNWQAEIERFAPGLSFFMYHGAGRDITLFESDILLTSYGVLRSDATLLKKQKWQVMIIDEAQNIKNQDTAQSKAVRSISAGVHIAMSGTPVENRLSEFWSIMDFVNKGYLDTNKNFKEEYARPIQMLNDQKCVERFRRITAPFMMRRLKSDKSIITDLPDKIEQNEFALLTNRQAALYEQTLQAAMNEIEGIEATDSTSLFKRQGLVLQMILALKQICNHPAQFLKNGEYLPELSGKSEMLLDLVESIVDSGEKVLIFTQFREMGEILQRFIEHRLGERPMFYHGGCSVKERQEMVNRFQTNRADKVFLLSLKAAGTGLNLTAASNVIHYDLWWNPAVEAQATDRAYRIGQHQNVIVRRFITKNTFEERIDEMIQRKKQLADLTVVAGESWIGKLSNKELRAIFE